MSDSSQEAIEAQQRARQTDQQLGRSAVDPPYAPDPEHPEGMSHEQIYEAINGAGGMDLGALSNLVQTWTTAATNVMSVFIFHRGGLINALQGRWESQGADAAQAASTRFANAGNEIGQIASSVRNRIESMYWAADTLKRTVPPVPAPVAGDPEAPNTSTYTLPNLVDGPADRGQTEAEISAYNQAVRAMENAYLPIWPPAGNDVPVFQAPSQLGDQTNGVPTSLGPSNDGPATDQPANGDNPPSQNNEESPSVAEVPGAENPVDTTEPSGPDPASTSAAAANPSTDNPARTPSGTPAATPNAPGNLGTTPNSPGTDRPQLGTPLGTNVGAPQRAVGAPGISRPAVPGLGQTPAGISNAASTGPAQSRVGTPGSSMGPGAGARRKDDEESTRQIPDYLIRQQPELVDLSPAVPQAIGADAGAATGTDAEATTSATFAQEPAPHPRTSTGTSVQYSDDEPTPTRHSAQAPTSRPMPATPAVASASANIPSGSASPGATTTPAPTTPANATSPAVETRTGPDSSTQAASTSSDNATDSESISDEDRPKTVTVTLRGPMDEPEDGEESAGDGAGRGQ